MSKLDFTKEELEKNYRKRLDTFLDDCDWVSYVTGSMLCSLVLGSLKDFGVEADYQKLYEIYTKKLESLNLTDEEWRENYGIPESIYMIYEIIEKNF